MISKEENRIITAMASLNWVRPEPEPKSKPRALELYYTSPKQLKLF
ncbi:hypothetical protein [Pseudanabaena mucicola]|jgi:hypothetical protein|nr:hypothetical protein [Pseudanabaena mucicola]